MALRRAERKKAKLRLGISGPAGSGKTASSLLMAYGITGDWEKIALIDTENGSGELYTGSTINSTKIGEYLYDRINSPYTPEKYINAIHEAEQAGIEVLIIDSLTHAWAGEGGLLDKKGQLEKKGGNSWTAWRDITPLHNRLVETILTSNLHLIATLRAKMDYVQEKDSNGKTAIRKVGMNPIQREGMEYEFTVFIDIDQEHQASASKDRTSMLDGKVFMPDPSIGSSLREWLEQGVVPPTPMTEEQKQRIIDYAKSKGWNGTQLSAFTKDRMQAKFNDLDAVNAEVLFELMKGEPDATEQKAG